MAVTAPEPWISLIGPIGLFGLFGLIGLIGERAALPAPATIA